MPSSSPFLHFHLGIPKYLAKFKWTTLEDGRTEKVEVSLEGKDQPFFTAALVDSKYIFVVADVVVVTVTAVGTAAVVVWCCLLLLLMFAVI